VARLEQLAPQRQEPALGSHLVTPRRGYLHHGIYVGNGKVVHYAGLAGGLHRGPVEEVPLARFTRGRPVWVKSHAPSNFECREVIQRARSRVGEDCYRLLTNNCEHFCEWCLRGEHRSYQVEALMARLRVLSATFRFLAHSVPLLGRVGLRPTGVATDG
jgi:lecithin:retinol acyltransferase